MTAGVVRQQAFDEARRRTDLSLQQLWLRYLTLGGRSDRFDVEAFLSGLSDLPCTEQDVLAHALNERLHEIYHATLIPYLAILDPSPPPPAEDPLAVLTELLHRSV